jgi:tetratricopeptide (TPR) repeat protein
MAGFTFEYIGNFKLENGKLVNQNTFDNKTGSMKHRLQSNTRNILILNKKQIVELKLENTSKWLTAYKTSEHLTSYKINIASFYNAVGGPEIALNILEETYKSEPEDTKLLFELSYSYNALKRYNDAKKILLTAIQKHPKDELFYKELSFTYMNTDDLEMSERTYDKFIEKAETKRYQVEMAYNLAYSFFAKKNKKKFEKWSKIVLDNSKGDSVFAKNIVLMKNELNK